MPERTRPCFGTMFKIEVLLPCPVTVVLSNTIFVGALAGERRKPQTSSRRGWVAQDVTSRKAGPPQVWQHARPAQKKKKKGWSTSKPRGCCHLPPSLDAGLASQLGEVSGKAPSDLNSRDFQQIKRLNTTESWAPGH